MRNTLVLLLLVSFVWAKPPESKGFVRAVRLREKIADQRNKLAAAEEYARKPREEKILIAFDAGQARFEKKPIDGKTVVETIFGWDQVATAEPSEAGQRCLEMIPVAFQRRFASRIEINKRQRYDASKLLVDALDSKYSHIREAAISSLKKIYRTEKAFMYEPEMDKKERRDPIRKWRSFIRKAK